MNRSSFVAAGALFFLTLVAPGPARAADTFGASSAGLSEQVAPASEDVRRARVAAFEKRNPGWAVDTASYGISRMRADIHMARQASRGAVRATTPAEAEVKAKAFVAKNADSMGLSPAEATALKIKTESAKNRGWADPRLEYISTFDGKTTQRGFESIVSVERQILIFVQVFDDGEVHSFSANSSDIPVLHIRSTPALAKDDPRVVAQLIGRPFTAYEYVSAIPGTYGANYRKKLLAPITRADVRSVKLTVVNDYGNPNAIRYSLVYSADLQRGNDYLTVYLDPDSGAVLKESEPPGPLVP